MSGFSKHINPPSMKATEEHMRVARVSSFSDDGCERGSGPVESCGSSPDCGCPGALAQLAGPSDLLARIVSAYDNHKPGRCALDLADVMDEARVHIARAGTDAAKDDRRAPLSAERLAQIVAQCKADVEGEFLVEYARAIERAHGIGAQSDGSKE